MKAFTWDFYSNSVETFRLQARQYFEQQCCNNYFGDLLPLIAANAFELQIVITSSSRLNLSDCSIVSPLEHAGGAYVALLLLQLHYPGTASTLLRFVSVLMPVGKLTSSPSVLLSTQYQSLLWPPPTSAALSTLKPLLPGHTGTACSTVLLSILLTTANSSSSMSSCAATSSTQLPDIVRSNLT